MLAAALVAVIGGLLSAVLFAASVRSRAAIGVVLAFAPVAPVAMAVAAFRPQLDPAGALATATPSVVNNPLAACPEPAVKDVSPAVEALLTSFRRL